ncbi:MAG: ABC transporter permease [Bacteroidales bacterium]|nr:ABC transporter permease [Bacteroidales bacterium]
MRIDVDIFQEILDSLTRNRRRSILTGFGIFWGLFMLLFMIGGGKGFKDMMSRNFEGFATNTVILFPEQTSKPYKGFKQGRYWNLKLKDVERLRNMVPELDVIAPNVSNWGVSVAYGDKVSTLHPVKGNVGDYVKIETPKIRYGRAITNIDVEQERLVCVIGKKIYDDLFPEGGNPCGKALKVGSTYFRIVGVDFSTGNISIQGNAEESVIIPFSVAQKLYHRGDNLQLICFTLKSGIKAKDVEPRIRQVLAREHLFDPTDEKALMILNTGDLFSLVDNLFRGINFLIWLVGLGTLLAGAIGVSNIMMVTVKERTTEIGIRRAIGATPSMILGQIMAESVFLTLAAGSLGIIFSVLNLSILEKATKNPAFMLDFKTAVTAVLLLAVLGLLAGLAPALKAMAVKPVDAMRDE